MKKIIISLVSFATVAISISSCSKTADGGIGTNPVTPHANVVVTKVINPDSIAGIGVKVCIASYNLEIVDSATKITVIDVYDPNLLPLQNVSVEIGTLYTINCSKSGIFSEGQDYTTSVVNKNISVGTYPVKVYATVYTTDIIDSTTIKIRFNCKGITTDPIMAQKIFFTQGIITTQKSNTTPITKNIAAGSSADMLTLNTTVIGKDYIMNKVVVSVTDKIVSGINVYVDGSLVGSAAVSSIGDVSIPTNIVLVASSTPYEIKISYTFAFYAGFQTGSAITATVSAIGYANESDNTTTYIGNPMYVYKSLLTIAGGGITQQISSAKTSLMKTTFAGNGALKQIAYKLVWTNGGTDTLKIPLSFEEAGSDVTNKVYFTNQNGDTISTATQSTTSIFVTFKSGSGESIIQGSKIYELKGYLKGFATDQSSVSISIGSDNYVQPNTLSASGFRVSIAGVIPNIILSDMSATGHNGIPGQSKSDWFSGYAIDMPASNLFYK